MYFNYVCDNSGEFYTIVHVPFQGILTPVPYSMAKDDSTMKVIPLLEKEYQSVAPSQVDTAVIDGMFLVRLISLISYFAGRLLVKAVKMVTIPNSPSLKIWKENYVEIINQENLR